MLTSSVASAAVSSPQMQDVLSALPELEVDTAKFPSERYKPVSVIGQGATGIVYLCIDKLLSKRVAIKTLHTVDSAQLIAFQQEAKTTSRLNHDNIIKVLDFGATEGGVPFMVMELVDGVSLEAAIVAEGPMEPAVAASLVRQICIGLEHAHKNGVLHRDVKSSNTLLSHTESGGVHPVVIDFGVSALKFARQEPTIVSGRTIVGSPFYMPPDQALGKKYDERSEIYSVGCTLFETLTGRTPFQGETTIETIGMHAHAHPPSLHDVAPEREFDMQLELLVARCLAKNPDERFQSCAELADALEHLIPELLETSERPSRGGESEGTALAGNEKRGSRPAMTALVAVLVAVGATVGLALSIVSQGQQRAMPQVDIERDFATNQWKKSNEASELEKTSKSQKSADGIGRRQPADADDNDSSESAEFGKVDAAMDGVLITAKARSATNHPQDSMVNDALSSALSEPKERTLESVEKRSPDKNKARPMVRKSYLEAIDDEFDTAVKGGLTRGIFGNGIIEVSATGRAFTDEDFKPLLNMKDVQRIAVMQKDITGEGLKYARNCPITSVMLRSCTLKEIAIQNVAQFKDLDNLELWKVMITRDGIKLLAKMPKLKTLVLVNTPIEDDWVEDVNMSKSIDLLSLDSNNNLTNDAVKYACENRNLRDLRFRRLKIDDNCVPYILNAAKKNKKLKVFMMIDCRAVSLPARKTIQEEMAGRGISCSIYDQHEEEN